MLPIRHAFSSGEFSDAKSLLKEHFFKFNASFDFFCLKDIGIPHKVSRTMPENPST
jgi:hypothetical protein